MPNLNKFTGVGHLGKDPEVRVSQSGTAVASFSVGITTSEKVSGEWTKTTEWVNCVCFGKQAEWLKDSAKGDLCIFSGRMKTEKYDKDGQTRYIVKIICDDVQTVKKSGERSAPKSDDEPYVPPLDDEMADQIPF